MAHWHEPFAINPVPVLLASGDKALVYFAQRDLISERVGPVDILWRLPEASKLLHKQQADGSWRYPSRRKHGLPNENYDLLETYRALRVLIEKYGFSNEHPAIQGAARYLFSFQTEEGDIRGIFGSEYAPHYTAWMMEMLIKAGYQDDLHVARALDWLLSMRQDDGGWAFPIRTAGVDYYDAQENPEPTQPDRSKPTSHLLTGGILRAFAVHPHYREKAEIRKAADLLKSRFFQPDRYSDRQAAHYWTKFQFPFWWPNLLTALDSLSLMGYTRGDEDMQKGLQWFVVNQGEDGLWRTSYKVSTPDKDRDARLWIALAVCRVFKRLYG